MAQHELMMLVGAPLIVAGRPLATCLWALPERWRRRIAFPLQRPAVSGVVRTITAPVTAWTLHGIVIWLWHMPPLYGLAVRRWVSDYSRRGWVNRNGGDAPPFPEGHRRLV
jgi:putative membrane protein